MIHLTIKGKKVKLDIGDVVEFHDVPGQWVYRKIQKVARDNFHFFGSIDKNDSPLGWSYSYLSVKLKKINEKEV